jgi:hypothetical protein
VIGAMDRYSLQIGGNERPSRCTISPSRPGQCDKSLGKMDLDAANDLLVALDAATS